LEQVRRRDLGRVVEGLQVPGKSSGHTEALLSRDRKDATRRGRPGDGELGGDLSSTAIFDVDDKAREERFGFFRHVAE
jgi:hypothetical protein